MIALSNNAVQTVNAGQAIIFNTVVAKHGSCECARNNMGSVKLCSNGPYEVHFHAVIGGAAGVTSNLAIALGGDVIPYSTMAITPGSTSSRFSVDVTIPVKKCCNDFDRITVVNTSDQAITVEANPLLYIHKEACNG